MYDVDEILHRMRDNIEFAQREFHRANPDGFDYFLARLSLNLAKIRCMYGRKLYKSNESSKG